MKPPQSKGFGSQLIEQALEGEQGRANFAFDPAGLACRLTLPL